MINSDLLLFDNFNFKQKSWVGWNVFFCFLSISILRWAV